LLTLIILLFTLPLILFAVATLTFFIFYFGGCPFISFLWNRIVDNAHNTHYNIVKLTERRDAMNE